MPEQTMLIVDDSRLTRMMVSNFVKDAHPDWTIIEAADGEEALRKVTGADIQWMTIDFNMPGMDGMEVAEKLKTQFPDAHICLLTANVQDAVRQRAEQLGIAFIGKPVTQEKILDYVA